MEDLAAGTADDTMRNRWGWTSWFCVWMEEGGRNWVYQEAHSGRWVGRWIGRKEAVRRGVMPVERRRVRIEKPGTNP